MTFLKIFFFGGGCGIEFLEWNASLKIIMIIILLN